eukprot:12242020-Prorocentrum_lima.AAC.1
MHTHAPTHRHTPTHRHRHRHRHRHTLSSFAMVDAEHLVQRLSTMGKVSMEGGTVHLNNAVHCEPLST